MLFTTIVFSLILSFSSLLTGASSQTISFQENPAGHSSYRLGFLIERIHTVLNRLHLDRLATAMDSIKKSITQLIYIYTALSTMLILTLALSVFLHCRHRPRTLSHRSCASLSTSLEQVQIWKNAPETTNHPTPDVYYSTIPDSARFFPRALSINAREHLV